MSEYATVRPSMPFMRGHAHTIPRRWRKVRTLIMKPVHHWRASYTLGSGVRSTARATKKGEMSRRPTIKRSRRLEGPDRDIRRQTTTAHGEPPWIAADVARRSVAAPQAPGALRQRSQAPEPRLG